MDAAITAQWNDSADENADFSVDSGDPFEGLTTREQDIFFRILDVLSEEFGDRAFEFYMENPQRIRQLIAMVKEQKIFIKKLDRDGWRALLEKEIADLRNLGEKQAATSGLNT